MGGEGKIEGDWLMLRGEISYAGYLEIQVLRWMALHHILTGSGNSVEVSRIRTTSL
jgi:hypothetical protein